MTEYFVDSTGQRWNKFVEIPPDPPQEAEWFWLYPDQFYQEIRSCAPCPAVNVFGDIENPTKTHSVILDEKIQLFQADLLALSEYGKHFWELDSVQRDDIAQAWRGLYGDHTAFTNWLPHGSPRRDYVTPENLSTGDRKYDKIRGTSGNSFRGVLVKNSKNNNMLRLVTFTPDTIPTEYGIEILQHPAVFFATIQTKTGAIKKFPQIISDVPVPLITNEVVYCEGFKVERYFGERRSPYYYPSLLSQVWSLVRFGVKSISNLILR